MKAIYHDFEEKYLSQSSAIFTQEKLRGLYERCLHGGRGAQEVIEKLFGCMSIEVFRALCRTSVTTTATMSSFTNICASLPSPLHEGTLAIMQQWSGLKDEVLPTIAPEDKLSLEADITVARSLKGAPTLYFLREDKLAREVELDTGLEWVEPMVAKLQQSECTLANLIASSEVQESDIQKVLQYLIALGLVHRKESRILQSSIE